MSRQSYSQWVAELLAVVGGDDDQGVPVLSGRLEVVEHPAELVIHLGHHAEVLGPEVGHLRRVRRRRAHREGAGHIDERMDAGIGGKRFAHLVGPVPGRPVARRGIGRVGTEVAGMGEPGPVPTVDPGQQSVGEEGRGAVLGRALGLGPQGPHGLQGPVAEGLQPAQPCGHAAIQQEGGVEPGKDALVGVEAGVGRVSDDGRVDTLVGVAEESRLVLGPTGQAGHVVEAVLERRPVGRHPVVHLVHPGVQGRPARGARCGLAVVGVEAGAGRGQSVEVRGGDDRMPGDGQAVGAELVQGHEEDVHVPHSCSPPGATPLRCPPGALPPAPALGAAQRSALPRIPPWTTSTF